MIKRSLLFALCVGAGSTAYAADKATTYVGHVVIDPEVETFTPCGSDKALWLDYDNATRKPMSQMHLKLRTKPYDSTYVVLQGSVGPKLDCGFCEQYEGSFKVYKVIEQRAASEQDCKK